ncbi:MAG TPA: hypothetical protein O0Y13_05220 [Methanocorpusculum sp.]|nr:hypothetical protein [Methanocorpusculum sp.]HJK62642.1 hypothetical protein [Methanocorpusculum sp.]HJK63441.1 hypothetical protein [Methanocorpusculum sp.]HJK68450.1 hypothetical protein [Methanocorpusculum sp.]
MLKRIWDFIDNNSHIILAFVLEIVVIGGCYIWRWKAFFILVVLAIVDTILFLMVIGSPEPDTEWARILANVSHLALMGVW